MKFTIKTHEEHLANAQASLADNEARLAAMMRDVERQRERQRFYEAQIAEAKRRNLDGFDPERFMVKRR